VRFCGGLLGLSDEVPLVSVGIPTYNNPKGLGRTLECITGQTYLNLEIIVSDNYSPGPETEHVVREFMKKDSRLQYFRQEENKGASFNFRFVLEKATGKYFMWAADDDQWNSDFINELVISLKSHPDSSLSMCAIKRIKEDGELFDILSFPYLTNNKKKDTYFVAKKIVAGEKLNIFVYGLFYHEFLKNFYRYWPNAIAGDRIFILLVSLSTKITFCNKVLHTRTVRSTSIQERYKMEDLGKLYSSKFPGIKYFFSCSHALIKCNAIPIEKKKYIPILILLLLYHLPIGFVKEQMKRAIKIFKRCYYDS